MNIGGFWLDWLAGLERMKRPQAYSLKRDVTKRSTEPEAMAGRSGRQEGVMRKKGIFCLWCKGPV